MDKATLFISHSSKDALVATAFSDFMTPYRDSFVPDYM